MRLQAGADRGPGSGYLESGVLAWGAGRAPPLPSDAAAPDALASTRVCRLRRPVLLIGAGSCRSRSHSGLARSATGGASAASGLDCDLWTATGPAHPRRHPSTERGGRDGPPQEVRCDAVPRDDTPASTRGGTTAHRGQARRSRRARGGGSDEDSPKISVLRGGAYRSRAGNEPAGKLPELRPPGQPGLPQGRSRAGPFPPEPRRRQATASCTACSARRQKTAGRWASAVPAPQPPNLVMHWNGKSWSRSAAPNPSKADDELFNVRCLSAKDCWAVGEYLKGQCLAWGGAALDRQEVVQHRGTGIRGHRKWQPRHRVVRQHLHGLEQLLGGRRLRPWQRAAGEAAEPDPLLEREEVDKGAAAQPRVASS